MKLKESELLTYTLNALKLSGFVHWRVSNGPVLQTIGTKKIYMPSSIKGFPDVAGITRAGVFFAIELKTATGRLRPEQVTWQKKLCSSNGVSVVLRSVEEIDEFILFIKETSHPSNEGWLKFSEKIS